MALGGHARRFPLVNFIGHVHHRNDTVSDFADKMGSSFDIGFLRRFRSRGRRPDGIGCGPRRSASISSYAADDEVPLAEIAARKFNTTHETRWVSRREFETDFPVMLGAIDQPSIDGANTYFVSKAAKQAASAVST